MTARPVQIAICDSLGPAYADAGAFVQAICDAAAIEWRKAGVAGVHLLDASFVDGCLCLVTGPGQEPLTRAAVRTFLEQKRHAA
ncbi:hypothetical protein [Aurantimonas sp. VKM B-3413]|uniref:hypothetical protein n=1 Tax=Aurantimonas sp. VKM B-3413 TaxID=2779401 RepID=UPI001E4D0AAF|nr:hypothetical protein [Aurantimonas sp. VKM B-3413]MCB8835973.1 hypothetical protein [Aurantimonas sp. VKM B-3413]